MRENGRLIVRFVREGRFVDTGLAGAWDGEDFVVPFHDVVTADSVARVVTGSIRRDDTDWHGPSESQREAGHS